MAVFKDTTITDAGKRLLAQALANRKQITFTKLETSDFDYEETNNIEEVINLNQVKQSINLSSVVQKGTFVTVKGVFTNRGLVNSYEIKTIGCFAKINDENEILYSITRVKTPDTMPAENGINLSTIEIELVTQINNESGAVIKYNPDTMVTRNTLATETEAGLVTLRQIKETVRENAPSLESYENIVNTHAKKQIYSEEGVHGLRYYDNELQVRKHEGDENLGEIEENGEVEWEKVELGDPWETNLEKLMGMPYGGTIQGASSKEAGKFYYDTSTKEYYECTENNALNYVESSKYRSMSRKNVGKGEIEPWDTTKNSKLSSNDRTSATYGTYDVGSFEIGNFIIKFGRTSSSIATQYFPTPFPNKCISVVLTPVRRVDIYVNIDVSSYNNHKFSYVGELHKINGICWIAIGY